MQAAGSSGGRSRRISAASVLLALVVAVATALGGAPSARASTGPAYAPLDQPGPPLSVPVAALRASLTCEPSIAHATRTPVLLNPATGVTAAQNYSWNWEPALDKLGIPWCAYTAPHDTLGDIETSGEYIVYAIRTMYALAGRRIAILGHSQGAMSMRWALRFWPDTRPMVQSVLGFSGTNHGTTVISASACSLGCPAADWQQFYESPFIQALNSGAETFAGIAYTEVWTHTDEVVQPNGDAATASAALHTGRGAITNLATQQVCPNDVDEHLTIGTIDPVAYAIGVDALTHSTPADPASIPSSVCSQLYMPGVNPLSVDSYLEPLEGVPGLGSVAVGGLAQTTSGAPELYAQPANACYVYAACRGRSAPTLILSVPRGVRAGHTTRVGVLVRAREGSALVPVPGVTVRIGRHIETTGPHGRAQFRVRLAAGHSDAVIARRGGCNPARARIAGR